MNLQLQRVADRQNFEQERQSPSKPRHNSLPEDALVLPEELRQVLPVEEVVGSLVVSSQPQLGVVLLLIDLLRGRLAGVEQELAHLTVQAHLGQTSVIRHSDISPPYFTPVVSLNSQLQLNNIFIHLVQIIFKLEI